MAEPLKNEAEPLVGLNGVGVFRSGRWNVRGVDLTIRRGQIVTLVGPNGSGKSTTAKVVTGVMQPDAGTVQRAPGLRIGYVPQKLSIDWTMPLNVERLMTLMGPLSREATATALDAVGIPHLAKASVQALSGGEFQRALLARAIARQPDLLVLDEPVQGVDFTGEAALYDLIRAVRDRTGCGILLISHDLHIVMAGTDIVICLNGHMCCSGPPESVAASPEYLNLFGPRAADSLAVYRHHHDDTHLPDGRVKHADGSITDDCHPDDGHHDHAGHDHGHAHTGRDDLDYGHTPHDHGHKGHSHAR